MVAVRDGDDCVINSEDNHGGESVCAMHMYVCGHNMYMYIRTLT
jgi:hypothetical protein